MAVSNMRRLLAQVALAAPGAWLLFEGLRFHTKSEMLFGALVVGGAALLGRRGVVAQVLGRGAAWAIAGPCLVGSMLLVVVTRTLPPPGLALLLAAAGSALALARPMLDSYEARTAFAPLAFRRWFALAASGAVGCAVCLSTILVETQMTGHPLSMRIGSSLLAGLLVASAVGVARMRAWGILLGAASVPLAFALGAMAHGADAYLALSALPGMMLVGGILAARARSSASVPAEPSSVEALRIASPPMRFAEAAPTEVDVYEELGDEPAVQRARMS